MPRLPFSTDEFFAVFAAYNDAIWPMQWVLYALSALAIALVLIAWPAKDRWINAVLGFLWAWSAIAYHFTHFSRLNPLAYAFAFAFLVQAVLFFVFSWRMTPLDYVLRNDLRGWLGGGLVLYALVAYPLVGRVLGHGYPAAPTFGVPCPLTIFTIGLLLSSRDRRSRVLLVIPVLWAIVGGSAAFLLAVPQDLGLIAAAVLAAIGVLRSTAFAARA